MESSVVVSVNTIAERDLVMDNIYNQLVNAATSGIVIQKERVNRIRVYYNENLPDNLKSYIGTYTVVVLPVLLNLDPLDGITGAVDFRLDATINKLAELTSKLQYFQGRKVIKENIHAQTFEQLVRCLA